MYHGKHTTDNISLHYTYTNNDNENTNKTTPMFYTPTIIKRIEGGELFDRVIDDDFILTEKACIVFIRQVCQAMEFIHRSNILHLDLKPENILCLTREGNRIKIIDFGLARKYDPDKKLQVIDGCCIIIFLFPFIICMFSI